MKKLLFLILILSSINSIQGEDLQLFNYTLFPGHNIFNNDKPVVIATGLFSSRVSEVKGIQFSPIFNKNEKGLTGIQNSLIVNDSRGESRGVQISGVINYADSIKGLQVANILNSADTMFGVQIGLVNRATNSTGLQLGLVNISDDLKGLTVGLGLINIYKYGILDLTTIYDSNGNIIYYYESGSSKFFSQFYLELNNEIGEEIDYRGIVWGTGLGFKIFPTFDVVVGAKRSFKYLFTKPTIQLSKGFNYKRFSLVIGTRGDLKISGYNDEFFTGSDLYFGDDYLSLYYSFFIGIRAHIDKSYLGK